MKLKPLIRRFHQRHNPLRVYLDRGLGVGNNFSMHSEVTIGGGHCRPASIGDNVTPAPRVHILAHRAQNRSGLHLHRPGEHWKC